MLLLLFLLTATRLPEVVGVSPCDATIPGYWGHATEVMTSAWVTPGVSFKATLPTGFYTNVSLSADNTTVTGVWSSGHHSVGNMSGACDAIAWQDGSLWKALSKAPPINVHISPHSHEDVGWGETYLQYYYGTGPYPAATRNVTRILSLVIEGLLADPARRFSYVEIAFFHLYWASLTPAAQADVRGLVERKQLVFLNAGYSMHDEAAPSYVDMLDNTALGHRLVADAFGVEALPTLTWQIDPFGHSAFQGLLSSPLGGFKGVMWGREPGDFKASCRPNKSLERVWLPSASLGSQAATFGASFYDPGYDWPIWNRCTSIANVSQCTREQGVKDAQEFGAGEIYGQRAPAVRGNDILINFGTDFAWINAMARPEDPLSGALFEYVDGVIAGLNADPAQRFHAFYSTASDYVSAKLEAGLVLPALVTDLFPYGDTHAMWTGYYSSRPAFKRYVRESSGLLQTARQLQALVGGVTDVGPTNPLFTLERAMGVAQHHDAISGTAVQNVNDDYSAMLAVGRSEALTGVAEALAAATGYTGATFAACELSNASLCTPLEGGQPTVVLVYNPLGQDSPATPVRVPAGFPPGVASWAVYDSQGGNVTAQLVPLSPRDAELRALYNATNTSAAAVQWLCFTGSLPPTGFAAFFLIPTNTTEGAPFTFPSTLSQLQPSTTGDGTPTITNGRVTLNISSVTGLVTAYEDAVTGVSLPLAQTWAAYEGFNGSTSLNGSSEASGAYIFRPARQEADPLLPTPPAITLVSGPVVSEAHATLGGYVTSVARLWVGGDGRVEFEFTVGPVEVGGNVSREVVARYSTGLPSGGVWRSDSNCWESQRRVRNARGNWTAVIAEPVAANYVPTACLTSLSSPAPGAVSAAEGGGGGMEESASGGGGEGLTLAVAVDSAQGSSSLVDGQLELMVHRRMMHLDGREPSIAVLRKELPMNEPGVDGRGLIVRGRHWVVVAPSASAASATKVLSLQALAVPTQWTFFAGLQLSPWQWVAAFAARASLLSTPLPPNLHLATVHVLSPTTWLLRLAHTFEAGEDAALSAPVHLDLATLFTGYTVVNAVDMTLPGSLPLEEVEKTTYLTEGGLNTTGPAVPTPPSGAALTVTLTAMQIRTLTVTVAPVGI